MRLNIKSLELSRFRSYVEPAGVLFPETGLVLVRGNGSGAGKSSLFMAIYDAIGICPVPATQLKSWHGDGCRRVSLQLEADGKDISIRRGEAQSLTIDGAEKAMESLPSALGVKDLEWLLPLTYRPQNGGSFFLSLGAAEKKSFLSSVLGLDALEKAFEESQEKMPRLQAAKEAAAARLASIAGGLQANKETLKGTGGVALDDLTAAQDAVRIAVEEAKDAVQAARADVAARTAEISQLQKQSPQLTPEAEEQVAALRAPQPTDPMVAQFESRLKAVDQQEAAASPRHERGADRERDEGEAGVAILLVLQEPEEHSDDRDAEADHHDRPAVEAVGELGALHIGQLDVRLAGERGGGEEGGRERGERKALPRERARELGCEGSLHIGCLPSAWRLRLHWDSEPKDRKSEGARAARTDSRFFNDEQAPRRLFLPRDPSRP